MNRHLAKTLEGAAAVLIAGAACYQASAAQSVLALCPAGSPVEAAHRLIISSTADAPAALLVTDAGKALPSGCRTSPPLPFPADAVRWLGALPGEGAASDRLALTSRETSGEILSLEDDRPLPPRPSRHLPSRKSQPGASLPKLPAAWVWEPRRWLDDPAELVAAASDTGVGAFYITVPIEAGAVQAPESLAAFIARCRAAGIEVYAVEGDPGMITGTGLDLAVTRAHALAHYRSSHPQAALDGVQYDIEPYLLPSFGAAPKPGWQRWSAALRALADALGEPVDAVIPFWIEDSPGGEAALAEARPALRSVTIMAYRTKPEQIMAAAAPALLFAERAGLPATVALEAGPIAQDRRRIYRPADTGDLHLAALGDISAALLLDKPRPAAGTRAFRQSHFILSDPGNVSFLGRMPELRAAAAELSQTLSAYPAAQRIAFHGLSVFASPSKPSIGQ
jgi:hypothetical protein